VAAIAAAAANGLGSTPSPEHADKIESVPGGASLVHEPETPEETAAAMAALDSQKDGA